MDSNTILLYYHKTDGGAEYLTDKFVICPNGDKEGVFADATIIVRLDGQAQLTTGLNGDLRAMMA